jgi:hypothetical protein
MVNIKDPAMPPGLLYVVDTTLVYATTRMRTGMVISSVPSSSCNRK